MGKNIKTQKELLLEIEALQAQLKKANDTLHAICSGAADKPAATGQHDDQIFALRNAEQTYRTLIEQMNDGAVIASDKHTILFCNVRFSEFIKTPREKILGSNLFDYLSKSDRSTVNTLLASATSENPSAEILLTASDGSYILAHLSLSKIIYGNSAVVCLIFTNLAERTKEFRHAKEQLRLAESKYRTLVEQIPAITYMAALDDAGARLYISPQIVSILGFSPDEWLSDPESWVKQLHPEDRKRVLAEYKSSHEKGQPFRSEYRWLTRDGRTLWCYDNAVLVKDKTGKPIFFQGIVTDITEYKRATEKIYLFQSLAMAISVSRNLHDALVVAIQKICNYTGWIYGEAWIPNQDGARLERDHAFYSSIEGLEKFSEYSCGFTFTPGGGLPGRAWAEKQPVWIKDVTQDPHYLRAAIAGEVGLKMGIGFPVISDGEVVSVFVFYSLKVEEINDNLIKLILSMLSQIGSIIKRIQAEEALKKSEEQYRLLFESNPHPMMVFDTETLNFLAVNSAAIHHYGYSCEEFLAMTIKDIRPPDDIPMLIEYLSKISTDYDTAGVWRHRKKDGAIIYVEITTHDITFMGRKARVVLANDITKRKQAEDALHESEERLRSILDNTTAVVYIKDIQGRYTFINRQFETLFHVKRGEIKGKTPYDCFPEEIAAAHLENDRKVFEVKIPMQFDEMATHDDGQLHSYLSVKFPLFDSAGTVYAVCGISTDITERKRMESEHKKLREQLYRSQNLASIGKLAGGVAHNFNNLLTVIMGYASLLNMEIEENSPFKEYTRKIIKTSQTAADLTQALLAFSRKQPVSQKPVNINEIVRQSEALLSKLIREDIVLTTALTDADTTVIADVGQIEQSLMNLATNARDAMPDGGNLKIRTEVMEMDDAFIKLHGYGIAGRYVHIAASDTGMGMDENTKLRVFDPFFTTKEVGKGTGLGLASVYGIVKQHSGYISVDSEPGRGATFNIYLPVIESEAEGEESEDGKIHAHFPEGGADTVLLAEDDPEVRELIRMVFERAGYRVIEAADGEDAIVKFMEHKDSIKLLVSDLIMPKKNGKEVCEAIKKMAPDIKVLFITGYDDNVIGKIGIHEGKFDYLVKPVSPVELLRKVREVLDKS